MDPITVITATISMLTPYLVKSGEKIAEEMGGSLWAWLKSKIKDKSAIKENPDADDKNAIQMQLMTLISQNPSFVQELENMIKKIQEQHVESSEQVLEASLGDECQPPRRIVLALLLVTLAVNDCLALPLAELP